MLGQALGLIPLQIGYHRLLLNWIDCPHLLRRCLMANRQSKQKKKSDSLWAGIEKISLMCSSCLDMRHCYTDRSARYVITFSLMTRTYRMRRLHMSAYQGQSTYLKAIDPGSIFMRYWSRISIRLIFDEAGLHRRVWHERSIHNVNNQKSCHNF